jgi:hypothetical protein
MECLPKIIEKICDIQARDDCIRLLISNSCFKSVNNCIKEISLKTSCKIRASVELDEHIVTIEGPLSNKKDAVLLIFQSLKDGESVHRKPSPSPRRDSNISVDVTVPDRMVARLIGKKGEHVKNMIDKSGCSITFHKTYEGCLTPEGEEARLCTLKGNTSAIAIAVRIILEQVSKLERD